MMTAAMSSGRHRSISGPIIYGSFSVALTAALLAGWVYVILKNLELTQQWVSNLWLLGAGVVSFLAIMTVLILFSVFLAREILEVRRQTTFVDSVTHELRSPLASLRLCLETLARTDLPDAKREQLRQMMLEDVERLSAFIDDILEAGRHEHGQKRASAVNCVPLRQLVQRCAGVVNKRHKISEDAIKIEIADDLQVMSDRTALEVVVKNLLDNAVKYSSETVDVRVRAWRTRDDRVRLEVSDQGVGIPKRALRRVFHRFYRVDDEAVRSRRGTGLGLFVVKALVHDLGGKLQAHSDGPGRGARMTVVLPMGRRDARDAADELPEEACG
jgi:signal transduction histidine kinase